MAFDAQSFAAEPECELNANGGLCFACAAKVAQRAYEAGRQDERRDLFPPKDKDAECEAIVARLKRGEISTIDAIKLVRMVSGMGLRESKAWVDRAMAQTKGEG